MGKYSANTMENGQLSARGRHGLAAAGGGSGGTIYIAFYNETDSLNTGKKDKLFYGKGNLNVNGGDGSSS